MVEPPPLPAQPRKLAIASLVCGLLFCIPVLPALAALVLGILALSKKGQGGKGMAVAGVVLGGVSLLAVPMLAAVMLPALMKARQAAERAACLNNVRAIVLAGQMHEMDEGRAPGDLDALVRGAKLEARCLDCRADTSSSADYVMLPYGKPQAPALWIYCKAPKGHGDRIPCGFTDGSARLLTRGELEEALRPLPER